MRQKILKYPHRLLSWFKAKSVKKKIVIVIGVIVLLLIISTSIQNALKRLIVKSGRAKMRKSGASSGVYPSGLKSFFM